MTDAPPPLSTCANCGSAVSGAYCSTCGQSRDALDRNFFALVFEQIGDVFSWDGRLFATVRELFTRPGRVAAEFVEGKRVSHTPPVRMLLLASLALFAVMSLFGLRIIAIAVDSGLAPPGEEVPSVTRDDGAFLTVGDDAETPEGTHWAVMTVTLFGGDRSSRLGPASAETIDALQNDGDGDWFNFMYAAFRDPAGLERAVNAAATQALFTMVAVFALLNLLLHPRRPFLLHGTHALYFHATVALAVAVWIVVARLTSLPGDWAALPPTIAFLVGAIAFDRGCYGTSVLGLILRMPVLFFGYAVAMGVVPTAFTLLSVPR